MPGVIAKVYAAKRYIRGRGIAVLAAAMALSLAGSAQGRSNGIAGFWREPGGSVIQIAPCGQDLCVRIAQLAANVPSRVDAGNPDPGKRTQPLCGLQIGYGFHSVDPSHAEDGWLYDPKNGKTYHGTISRSGDTLLLRGYVGIKMFGRTERWSLASENQPPCH